jgi:hypothetical protein
MDAIVKLPASSSYDSIMVFVDHLTKMAHFLPFQENGFDAPELAKMFEQHVAHLHGLPRDTVSGRGPVFNNQFWRSFFAGLGIKLNFSTAFHPQSDVQTESVNRRVEQYLWTFCRHDQTDWHYFLLQAEFAYNNFVHTSTGFSPYEATYGYHPLDPTSMPTNSSSVPAATNHLDNLKTIHAKLKENLAKAQASHAKFYNRHVKDIESEDNSSFSCQVLQPSC